MIRALPQADVTRNLAESRTSTKAWCAARTSLVDCPYSLRSGIGSVEIWRTSPATSARVGLWMVGAADPSAAEVPGSSAATSPIPVSAIEPGVADTARCHQPGFGMVTVATYETVAS